MGTATLKLKKEWQQSKKCNKEVNLFLFSNHNIWVKKEPLTPTLLMYNDIFHRETSTNNPFIKAEK